LKKALVLAILLLGVSPVTAQDIPPNAVTVVTEKFREDGSIGGSSVSIWYSLEGGSWGWTRVLSNTQPVNNGVFYDKERNLRVSVVREVGAKSSLPKFFPRNFYGEKDFITALGPGEDILGYATEKITAQFKENHIRYLYWTVPDLGGIWLQKEDWMQGAAPSFPGYLRKSRRTG